MKKGRLMVKLLKGNPKLDLAFVISLIHFFGMLLLIYFFK